LTAQTLHLRIQTPSGSKRKKEEESNIQYNKLIFKWLFLCCWRWLDWAFFTNSTIFCKFRDLSNSVTAIKTAKLGAT
jgi:hypothetical protein